MNCNSWGRTGEGGGQRQVREVKGVYLLWLEKLKGRGAWRKGTVGSNQPKLNVL